MPDSPEILFVTALDANRILVRLSGEGAFAEEDVQVDGGLHIEGVTFSGHSLIIHTSAIDPAGAYQVRLAGLPPAAVDPAPLLDELYSDKPLGVRQEGQETVFRLFAPRARKVSLLLSATPEAPPERTAGMQRDADGVWEARIPETLWDRYYAYQVQNAPDQAQPVALADPYARAVCSQNDHLQKSFGIIVRTDDYDWRGDAPLSLAPADLILYEAHVRDMSMHPGSGIARKGTYAGLVETAGAGGLTHILELGVNAVELLPCQHFAKIEPPYAPEEPPSTNTWNPYARNHWGYMTSYFFAPEPYYDAGVLRPGDMLGADGGQVRAFKEMVKAFHRAGIAVVMDVVYNHVSNFDLNPLRYIDPGYYFRLDERGELLSASGCGNDFKSERRMARRLIIDSVKYWLETYHIDGLRFDLAAMLDWATIAQLTEAARKINPHVILIAEPWGGGKYDLASFSEHGWLAWNDLFRNGIKGREPLAAPGAIFGNYYGTDNENSLRFYLRGSRREDGGPFVAPEHSVNYLESHDGYTLGDFIRLGTGAVGMDEKITDLLANARLDSEQMRLNKLAALFLLVSRGAVMLHAGQEFARSKVIAETDAPDPRSGCLDHNSYEKDNETNWLDFGHKTLNREMFDYYRGLIALRNHFAAFRHFDGDKIRFLETHASPATGFLLSAQASGDPADILVLLNASRQEKAMFTLPSGSWRALADDSRAAIQPFGPARDTAVQVPESSGLILIRQRA